MDLTPGAEGDDQKRSDEIPDEVYLSAALAQQAAWRPDEDPDYQRHIAVLMTEDAPFRVAIESAYRAGREDAAKEKAAMLDALRRLRDSWYRQPGWTAAADTVDVLIDAFADGNQPRTIQEPSPSEHTQDGGE